MKLKEYFEKYGTKKTFFARKAGLTYQTVWGLVINCKRKPHRGTIMAIERATEGEVTEKDFENNEEVSCQI